MVIGVDGSRAFLKYRTGIEEYSYQVIKHLRTALPQDARVRLYVRKKIAFTRGRFFWQYPARDFSLPENWQLVGLFAPRFWTQIRLSLEMLWRPVDALFIPAHTVPVIHPKNTFVVVHGLEYEKSPQSYSVWERFYMRVSIRYSVWAAQKVVAVSHNTKADLERLYKVPDKKITVVYEGFPGEKIQAFSQKENTILFIGRLEERKNVKRIIRAFEILQGKTNGAYILILAGKPGFGYEKIAENIRNSDWRKNIQELGYVSSEEKNSLLQSAKAFVFPSLYEGFGLPVLEAQAAGTAVITSNTSSLPEVGGEGAFYVDPLDENELAEKLWEVLNLSPEKYQELIKKGYRNLEKFSWEKCAREMAEIIKEN